MKTCISAFLLCLLAFLFTPMGVSAQGLGGPCTNALQTKRSADSSIMLICRNGMWQPSSGAMSGETLGGACPAAGMIATTSDRVLLVCLDGKWEQPEGSLTDADVAMLTTMLEVNTPGTVCNSVTDRFSRSLAGAPMICRDGEWVSVPISDKAPHAITFADQNGVELNSTITSNPVTLMGFEGPLTATCTGCVAISRNGVWGGANVSGFMPGDTIAIQQISAATPGTQKIATLSIGTITSAPWRVTTLDTPAAPAALAATGITQTQITWNWGSSSGATGYWWGASTTTTTNKGTGTSHTETGLSCGTTYTRYVRASNAAGQGDYRILTAATLACPDTAPNAFAFTNQSGVALSNVITSNAVALNGFDGPLTASCSGCTGIARNGTWGTTSVSGFMPGDTIAIRRTSSSSPNSSVTATATVGSTTSASWTVTTGSTPSAPSALSATNRTTTDITWNWSTVSGASGYKWGATTSTTTAKGSSTSHTETGLTCGTNYTRYARAYNSVGDGDTVTLSAATLACPVPPTITLSMTSYVAYGGSWSQSATCSSDTTSSSATQRYTGTCAYNGTYNTYPGGACGGVGAYTHSGPGDARSGCTLEVCISATGPGGTSSKCATTSWQ